MFVANLTFTVPLEEALPFVEPHFAFLDIYYAKGLFIASGPKTPTDGGMLLVKNTISREELEQIFTEDPLIKNQKAKLDIYEFTVTKRDPEFTFQ